MAAPQEQLRQEAAPAAAEMVVPSGIWLPGVFAGNLREYGERQIEGDAAYASAQARRRGTHGLDEEAMRQYEKASLELMEAGLLRAKLGRSPDPRSMLKRAASMAWQAEGTPYGAFYERPWSHVSVRANLQELAMRELNDANDILLGRTSTPLPIETTGITPGLVAVMAAEAAEEAGIAEHVLPEVIVAGGLDGLERFMGEKAISSAKFTALVADKEATGLHDLPLEA